MKKSFLATFAFATVLFGLSSCSVQENPVSPSGNTPTQEVAAPGVIKDGFWVEYEADMTKWNTFTQQDIDNSIGMLIEGDKASFTTFSATSIDDLVDGKVSYNKETGKGTISFPGTKVKELAGQTVDFIRVDESLIEFYYTYQGQTHTGRFAYVCKDLDNFIHEIDDEDWKALMEAYKAIPATAGPTGDIEWPEDIAEPLPIMDEAANQAPTRSTVGGVTKIFTAIGDVFSSLFDDDGSSGMEDTLDEINEKLDKIQAKLDQMDFKLDEILGRLDQMASQMKKNEAASVLNTRTTTYLGPIRTQNVAYYNDARKYYKEHKSSLSSSDVKKKLAEYGKLWVGNNNEYMNKLWQYLYFIETCSSGSYGTGLAAVYDGLTFDKYPWEHQGIGDRQQYRTVDASEIQKALFMVSLYIKNSDISQEEKKGYYNNLKDNMPRLKKFVSFEVVDNNKFIKCQIPGAHFVMHKEIQAYWYQGHEPKIPSAKYGRYPVYNEAYHEAGSLKLPNPDQVNNMLLKPEEMVAMYRYFCKTPGWDNYGYWEWMLIDKNRGGGGAYHASGYNHPSANVRILMLQGGNHEAWDDSPMHLCMMNACYEIRGGRNDHPSDPSYWHWTMGDLNQKYATDWTFYEKAVKWCAAIVESRY